MLCKSTVQSPFAVHWLCKLLGTRTRLRHGLRLGGFRTHLVDRLSLKFADRRTLEVAHGNAVVVQARQTLPAIKWKRRYPIRASHFLVPRLVSLLVERKQHYHRLGQHDRRLQRSEQKYPLRRIPSVRSKLFLCVRINNKTIKSASRVVKVAGQKVRGSAPKSRKIKFYRKILLFGKRESALMYIYWSPTKTEAKATTLPAAKAKAMPKYNLKS